MAESEGVDAITVHPRTRSQRFTGKAPWAIIAEVVEAVRIPVTGNGDVKSMDDARRMVDLTGCQSVMVGRGALGSPWIFDEGFDALRRRQRIHDRFGQADVDIGTSDSRPVPERQDRMIRSLIS